MTNHNQTIEAVARAIADQIGPPFDQLHKNKLDWLRCRGKFGDESRDVNGPFQDDCIEAARAAIKALQEEPSAEMIDAGRNVLLRRHPDDTAGSKAKSVFRRMLQAAGDEG